MITVYYVNDNDYDEVRNYIAPGNVTNFAEMKMYYDRLANDCHIASYEDICDNVCKIVESTGQWSYEGLDRDAIERIRCSLCLTST